MRNSTSALTQFISKWREHEIVLWLYMTVISTFGVGVGDSDVGESRVQGHLQLCRQFEASQSYIRPCLQKKTFLHIIRNNHNPVIFILVQYSTFHKLYLKNVFYYYEHLQ